MNLTRIHREDGKYPVESGKRYLCLEYDPMADEYCWLVLVAVGEKLFDIPGGVCFNYGAGPIAVYELPEGNLKFAE